MSDAPAREWRFYIDDMIACAERAISYTEGLDQESFVASGLNYDATIRNLELIGEAATHIPDAVREAHPEISWRQIVATRNRLIHGYLGIDNDIDNASHKVELKTLVLSKLPGKVETAAA